MRPGRTRWSPLPAPAEVLPPGGVIKSITATPINIPLQAPYRWSGGVFPGFSKTIVQVRGAEGALGIGEAPNAAAVDTIEELIAPSLIGANAYDLADCERRVVSPSKALQNTDDTSVLRAFGGVEMALWDLVGKIENRSVASLLGGRVRDTVEFTEYFAFRIPSRECKGEEHPTDVARYCARMLEEFESPYFEGKVGVEDLSAELRMVSEVREAIGQDRVLRLDANMAWSVGIARDVLRRLEAFDISSIEEPVPSLPELARLRSTTSIPFSSHEPDCLTAVRLGVPDAFVINLTALGGIRRSVQFIHACEELGFDVWFYSPDTGVANAAYLQVASAMEWIDQPSQTLLRWQTDDVIAEGPFVPVKGQLSVPSGAGLGVTLDEVALKRCHERFVEEGPYDQYAIHAEGGIDMHRP